MSVDRLRRVTDLFASTVALADPPRDEAAFEAFLDRASLDPADRASLKKLGPKRFFLYRTLVRGNFRAAIRGELSETAELLGDRFDLEVAAFFDRGMPRSHYMLDAAFEFIADVRERWPSDPTLPAFALDLARHELLSYEVSAARSIDDGRAIAPALAIDAGLVFDGSARLAAYAYPVHLFEGAGHVLAPKPTWLVVYRDEAFDIRHLELTDLAAAALRAWQGGATLKEGLERACAELTTDPAAPRTFAIEDAAKFLADLAERKVLLGAAVKPAP